MKHLQSHYISLRIWSVMILALLVSVSFSEARANHKLSAEYVIGTVGSPPHWFGDGSGIYTRIITEMFRGIGKTVQVIAVPSERALINANNGIEDGQGFRIAGIEKDYPNLIRVPEVAFQMDFVAYGTTKTVPVRRWQDLSNLKVGYVLGWKIFEKNLPKTIQATTVTNEVSLFRMLDSGRIDVALYNHLYGPYLNKHRRRHVESSHPPLAQRDMFLYLNAKHADIVPLLAQSLREMKETGSYQAILESNNLPQE